MLVGMESNNIQVRTNEIVTKQEDNETLLKKRITADNTKNNNKAKRERNITFKPYKNSRNATKHNNNNKLTTMTTINKLSNLNKQQFNMELQGPETNVNNSMETNEDEPTTSSTTAAKLKLLRPALNNNNNKTKENSKQPPILIKLKDDLDLNKTITQINKFQPSINVKFTSNYMILSNVLKESCDDLNKFLTNNDLEFFTYTAREDKLYKFVIKGLPNLDLEVVKDDLTNKGIEVAKIAKMKSSNVNTIFTNFFVSIKDLTQAQSLSKIRAINSILVRIEKYENKSGITQCYNCQAFGHGSSKCHIKARCVKCAGNHTTAECTKDPEQKPKCANCNSEHTANYNGCASLQNYKMQKQLKKQQNALSSTSHNRFISLQDNQQFPTLNSNNNKKMQFNNSKTNNQNHSGNSQQLKQQLKYQQIQQLKQQIQQSNAQLQQLCNEAIESNTPSYADIANMGAETTISTPTSFNWSSLSGGIQHTSQQQSANNSNMQNQGESFSDLVKTLIGFINDIKSNFDLPQLINKVKLFIFKLKNNQGSKLEIVLEFILSFFNE